MEERNDARKLRLLPKKWAEVRAPNLRFRFTGWLPRSHLRRGYVAPSHNRVSSLPSPDLFPHGALKGVMALPAVAGKACVLHQEHGDEAARRCDDHLR